jgi:hypothetical protein
MPKRKQNELDSQIEKEYYAQGSGVEILIMDIPRIFTDCRTAVAAGTSLKDAVAAAIARYRQN